ncbi:hypothetical protein TNCV_987891 [Trichonephila clavipes]|nr:hypothetical protein TNCV_987891 [Trichonephila clavipes]
MKEGCGWQNGMKLSLLTSHASVCNTTISLSHSSSTHCRCFKQPALHLRGVGASCPSLPSGLGHSHISTG